MIMTKDLDTISKSEPRESYYNLEGTILFLSAIEEKYNEVEMLLCLANEISRLNSEIAELKLKS
jgi:hypothetical protein